jgi:hypothetical protein
MKKKEGRSKPDRTGHPGCLVEYGRAWIPACPGMTQDNMCFIFSSHALIMIIQPRMIEKIPFLHKQKMYNIITEDDLTFTALHYIIDDLIEQGAFLNPEDCAELFTVVFEKTTYTIGVDGTDILIAVR